MLLCCLNDAVLLEGGKRQRVKRRVLFMGRVRERGGMINKESAMIGGKTQDNLRRANEKVV